MMQSLMMIICGDNEYLFFRKPVHMVYDDSMGDDHHEQRKSPKHCRREYEVGELLRYKIF